MPKELIIIGNGFDLSLGLKTSYANFINSIQFSEISATNFIAKEIKRAQSLRNWIDVERELAILSKIRQRDSDVGAARFYPEYVQLKEALRSYISEAQGAPLNKNSPAHKLLVDEVTPETEIISFNYTDAITRAIKDVLPWENKVHHIHGSCEAKNIIFGVEDHAEIGSSHAYIYKSGHANYIGSKLKKLLLNSNDIAIFGHSLGQADHNYFSEFFTDCAQGKHSHKAISIYYYNDASRGDIVMQLQKMTGFKLGQARDNAFEFNLIQIEQQQDANQSLE